MEARWSALCERLGAGEGDAGWTFVVVRAMHAWPARAYHTLGHVGACLLALDAFEGDVQDRDAVELALWFHDCVYDPTRSDNEERSAEVAVMVAARLGAPAARVERVRELILATRHAGAPAEGDARVIADVDLSVLGAPWEEYRAYAAGIRAEYAFASDERYAAGRGAFLRGMLGRERIYWTGEMRGRLESGARENMKRELEGLGEG